MASRKVKSLPAKKILLREDPNDTQSAPAQFPGSPDIIQQPTDETNKLLQPGQTSSEDATGEIGGLRRLSVKPVQKKAKEVQVVNPSTLTAHSEEVFSLGYIPVDNFSRNLKNALTLAKQKKVELTSIDFGKQGYITDALIKTMVQVLGKKGLANVARISLEGCSIITDMGLHWLVEGLAENKNKNIMVNINGCTKVGDGGLAALVNCPSVGSIEAMATMVTHLSGAANTKGCPLLANNTEKKMETQKESHVLIVPLATKQSLGACLESGKSELRQPFHHMPVVPMEDWKINITEVERSHVLFSPSTSPNPVHAIITFDASSDLQSLKEEVGNTIAHVISKELVNPKVSLKGKKLIVGSHGFMDTYLWNKCDLTSDGVLRNTSDTPGVIGAVVSKQPLSRSNPYFEVQCLVSGSETGLILGVMHDILLTDRFPLDSKERSGGAVDGQEMVDGAVYGFGVKGTWQSEYVPGEDAKYYFTKDGEELKDKKTPEDPHIGMYPIVSVMGKNFGAIKFLNMACPPGPLLKQWEDKDQWWTPLFHYNLLYDDSGIVSYMYNYKSSGSIGLMTFQQAITRFQNTFTIKILKKTEKAIITMGLGPEDYPLNRQPGWDKGSIAFHGDNGKFYIENGSGSFEGSGSPTVWNTGDEITAVVKDFGEAETIQPEDTVVVDFYHNQKLIQTVTHKLAGGKRGVRYVFMLSINGRDTSVKVQNFRPAFFPPPPRMDMLTMGRVNFMNIYDDGRLAHRRFDKRELFSTFISKTPFNRKLNYFEVRVKHLGGNMHAAIGFAPPDYPVNNMVGWLAGSVGYHADNGYIYDNEPHGTAVASEENATYRTGDVVGCGFEPQGVTYREDGTIESQQTLRFYFTKNGKKVHVVEHLLLVTHVFPTVNLHFEPDELILENFYSGAESGEMGVILGETKHPQPTTEIEETFIEGCQVTLVGMGTEQEMAGKVQLLRGMMENSELQFQMLRQIEDHITLMESDLSLMDLQGQQLYGLLSWQKECLNRFQDNMKSRVKVMALDVSSSKGKEELINRIVQVCESDLAAHPHLYNLQNSITEGLDKVIAQVKTEKMIASRSLKISEFHKNTRMYEQAVRFLQAKGKIIWVPMKRTVIALDIEFAKTLIKMSSSLPSTLSGNMAPCIGTKTKVWNSIAEIFPDVAMLDNEKWELLGHVLLVIGVMEIPRVRVTMEDPQFYYCTPSSLGPLPVQLSDFRSNDKDVVIVWREYLFLYSCATHILSMVVSRCLLVSHPVAISKDWAVFQSGAAQTLIYIHKDCSLRLETRCYMPSHQTQRIDFDTQFHVEEYSFNIFCIFSDMIDLIITRLRLKVTYTQSIPRNMVNTSIGCIHNWGLSDDEFRQTVCTLCNQCCNKGRKCPYNRISSSYKHRCGCNTMITGCRDCGICQGCAELLWTIRSYLRPNLEVASYGHMQSNGMVPLDATTYDELEFTNLGLQQVPVCLTANTFASESKGVITKMFPSHATEFPNLKSLEEHMQNLQPAKHESDKLLRFSQGDTVTVKLDPIKRDSKMVVVVEDETPLEVTPVYFTCICRESTVWHDTGIVTYTTLSTAIPVGQFISALPLTRECPSFSIEIINKGEYGYIAIGVCPKRYPPNRQPGWNSGSIGYHADDGGIFVAAGWPATKKEKCTTGDIMECRLDFDNQTVVFSKNGNEVYVSRRQRSLANFYAAVGFHSSGEAVRLLEKEPWRMPEDQEPTLPSAFDAYKYGNMHISPGRTLALKKVGTVLKSWLMIHNPSKAKVGYKIIPTDIVKDTLGFLEPSGVKAFALSLSPGAVGESVYIHWFLLESTRDYTNEDLNDVYNHTTSESLLSHRLKVKVTDVQSTDSRPLKPSSEDPDPTDCYLAEVFKNGILVASYWLKSGSYVCALPQKCDVLVRYPKFPTLDQPNGFQKGMRVILDLTKTQKELYAEAIIEEVTVDGSLRLEYSLSGETINACMEAKITSPEISIKEIEYEETERAAPGEHQDKDGTDQTNNAAQGDKAPDAEKKVEKVAVLNLLSYQSRGHISVTKRAYMYPPFHLLTEASRAAIASIDESWKANTLSSVAQCKNVPTRLTVQEFQISELVASNLDWLNGSGRGSKKSSDMAFVFMPSDLNMKHLCYPRVGSDMFTYVDVHKLCFYWLDVGQQLKSLVDDDELTLDLPLHFVDQAPAKFSGPGLTPEDMYACSFNGWVYSTLTSKKLCLPSFENIFAEEIGQLKRPEVEHMMSNLLHVYAAQCHIFAEQYGGLQFQATPDDRTNVVINSTDMDSQMYLHSYCGAHNWSLGLDAGLRRQTSFRKEVFSPYEDTIYVFDQELPNIPTLPLDFFQFFKNLQYVNLQGFLKLKEIPNGVSNCGRLKMLSIKNSGLESLPADLFLAPHLCRLHCSGLPVKSLPTSISERCQVTELVLSWMLLSSVPKELGQLVQLKYLDLSGNPLVTLPMELKDLTKLKTLLLSGIPWLVTEGHVNGVSTDEYMEFMKANPSLTHIIGEEKLMSMFHECDHNKNQRLDGSEATALNMHIFWQVPRLGSSCISDTEYGGIPPVVFLMSSLEILHLNFQALTAVPVHMCRLQNLRELSVSNNPLLESVPGALGHLPNLRSIRLNSNPSLRTPPHEVVSRGFASIKAYLKRLAGGFTECRRTKLMLVGLGGAGKTSLLRALMSNEKKTAGTKGEDITNGIDILPWTIKSEDGTEVTYSTWDFAGQTLYYNTHQFFLSKRAVYLLLWSTRQGFEHAGLEFWLSSIASHAPKTPIFVIGTHCDQVPKADIPMSDLQERFKQIAGFHFVSSIEGKGIKDLERDLLRVTLEQKNMGEKVPQVWLNMEKKILAARLKNSILPWTTIQEFGMEVGIYDEKDIREAVQFLHELGTVQYFDNEFLRKQVVINPQWIVDVMSCVVSVKNSPIQDHKGRFLHKYIPEIWASYPKELHEWLLRLTEEFDLTFPLPEDKVNIVPCLLPQEVPKELSWPAPDLSKNIKETKLIYKFTYLPAGLFNRAQVRLFQLSDGRLIWKRGSLLKKNKHKALISQTTDFELQVKVQGPRPENVIFLIHEIFESLIKESFHGVVYEFLVPCPDCVLKEGTLDPSMFEGSLVTRARELKAPFLQCRKYFHTISMAQLYQVMPSDGTSDFDAHLQNSLIVMQQLTSDLSTDVAIIYSSLDMADDRDSHKVNPEQIKRDLEASGLTCWFTGDMDGTPMEEIMLALKNCKVVVALVSDNFESDSLSQDLLLYTMDTLNKDFVIVVFGDSMEWQNKHLGMRIGKHEEMVMVKNKSRYNQERINGMISVVNTKLENNQPQVKSPPSVFISYCWANSRIAQSLGTRGKPEALGWGDPREIKQELENRGISCWLDNDQPSAGKGLYKNIVEGIRNSKVLVACISDEYAVSDNCMMELRFGILTMNLPTVVVIVGTGNEWKQSEVGILIQRSKASKVYFQKENSESYDILEAFVRERLPENTDKLIQKEAARAAFKSVQQKEKSKEKKKVSDNSAIQEEYELMQRKFMRHIISYVSTLDEQPTPRLLVVDFEGSSPSGKMATPAVNSLRTSQLASEVTDNSLSKSSKVRRTMRPKTANRSMKIMSVVLEDKDTDWDTEQFCLKVLCENEKGWHVCKTTFPLRMNDDMKNIIKGCSVYLARMYAILRQSSVPLNCFENPLGQSFVSWVEQNAMDHANFVSSYMALRAKLVDDDDAQPFLSQLQRYLLPTGKIFWLCEEHASGPRTTRLPTEGTARSEVGLVLFEEDVKLREAIVRTLKYSQRKSAPCPTSSIKLPPMEINQTPAADTEDSAVLLQAMLPTLEPTTNLPSNSTKQQNTEITGSNSKTTTSNSANLKEQPPVQNKVSSSPPATPKPNSKPLSAKTTDVGSSSRKQSSVSMKAAGTVAATSVAGVRQAAAAANSKNNGDVNGKGSKTCILQ
ncbi:hypothetical protein RRG08_008898 [Elysia crispata]|uniref:non-specific serine/threonine protein kinase n=1 Tax=Elysia crispata TaxID=231223 RepID=A0AAE0ZXD0_9GAST|nr:hypothetical protein RRG08_008898 [Elysia crispata]